MKVRSKLNTPKASNLFTDREEPRTAFWHKYDTVRRTLDEGNIHVLTYYGIGGIGKSSLLKKLMEEMDERLEDPGYVYYDLNLNQESREVLKALKSKLESAYGFRFPLFELALYFYGKKIGDNVKAPEATQFAKKSPMVELGLDLLKESPILGSAVKVLEMTDKGVAVLRTYIKNHKRELEQLKGSEPEEVLQRLPEFFALDLQRNLEDAQQPLVIFLDTYEKLVNEMEGLGSVLEKDLWLRGENGLVQNVSGVLWVIAGREKLKWVKFDSEWGSALEQHLLGNLSSKDSTQFLALAGVEEEELRKDLYKLTGGTPVYLDLCVGQYHNLKAAGERPEIGHFGDNAQTLIQRFAKYMDDSHKDLVYLMAAVKRWNDGLFFDLAEVALPGFSPTTYEKVKEFSFVIQADETEYNIHQTVGDVLLDDCPKVLLQRLSERALAFFEERVKTLQPISEEFTETLRYLLQFAQLRYENDYDLQEWFGRVMPDLLGDLRKTGLASRVELVLNELRQRAEKRPVSLLYAWFRMEEAVLLLGQGCNQEAFEAAEKTWGLAEGIGGKKSLVYARSLEVLAQACRSINQHTSAFSHSQDALYLREELQGARHPETMKSAVQLAKYFVGVKEYQEALELLDKVREDLRQEESLYDDLLQAENIYAGTLSLMGRNEESLAALRELVPKYEAFFGKDHMQTSIVRYNLAAALRACGFREEGRNLRWEVYEKRLETLGKAHPKTLLAQKRVAKDLEEDGDPEMARIVLQFAAETYWDVWGPTSWTTRDVLRYFISFLKRNDFRTDEIFWSARYRRAEIEARNTGMHIDENGTITLEVKTKPEEDGPSVFQRRIAELKARSEAMKEEKARMEAYFAEKEK